jgi:hypothetical protein
MGKTIGIGASTRFSYFPLERRTQTHQTIAKFYQEQWQNDGNIYLYFKLPFQEICILKVLYLQFDNYCKNNKNK